MSKSFQLGPLVVPFSLLLLWAAAAVAFGVGRFADRRNARRTGDAASPSLDGALWQALLVALVVARVAFVWQYRSAYFAAPLAIIDIRDGGWSPSIGLAAAWLFAMRPQWRGAAMKVALRWALAAGTLVWVVGTIALSVQPDTARRLPPLDLTTLQGLPVKLTDFEGKPTVVNLWATWCPPCAREMPLLQKAQADHPELNFVFVNQRERPDQVSAWLALQQLPLRNVLLDDKGRAAAAFDQEALPTTFFFDAKGQWVATRIGELSAGTLSEKLEALRR